MVLDDERNQSSISENGLQGLKSVVRTPNQEGFQDHISEVSEKMQGLLDQALPSLAPLHLLAILSKKKLTHQHTPSLLLSKARAVYNSWDCLSPDGFALNSKWNDAEKYICNPLSGEVPVECLSAKTLSGRSFRNPANRITMSAPLVYSSHSKKVHTKPSVATPDDCVQFPLQEKKMEGMTRDVGTQSTPPDLSSSSPSPTSTPPITERSFKRCEAVGDSPKCNDKLRAEGKVEEEKETRREKEEETTKGESEKEERKKKENEQMWRCSSSMQGGCLSWMRRRQRKKHKTRKRNIFLLNLEGC
ncbi:uncharacterized protein LOC110647861 isoform X2 [Hevea brasiliensis]|uniref:uncharacterized protein LOC110647861 isoform X2 n=1 Tax=Hevea brasiliensis TaxID=3981 RepID=UPI0025E6D18B|nr:uncharacterized protein LOC110647861 isoform X2 [Hevea brasiliensis]